jgi:hypothetical protein
MVRNTATVFQANLEAFGLTEQTLGRRTDGRAVSVTAMPGGALVQVGAENGRVLHLHSPRDPAAEAERQVGRWLQENRVTASTLVIVIGLAGGWHVNALREHLPEGAEILVVDPFPDLVAAVLREADLTGSDRVPVRVISAPEAKTLFTKLQAALEQRVRIEVAFFTHPAVLRAFPEVCTPFCRRVASRVRLDLMLRSTVASKSGDWLDNALGNLPLLLESTPLNALRDCFAGRTAAVVAAGPSLNETIPVLGRIRDRVVIVAVGTALKPLLAAGIEPHIVVLVDGSPLLRHQFEGVEAPRTSLLVPPQIDPAIVSRFAGRLVTAATAALPMFELWMEDIGAPTDRLQCGGTVTLTALDAALYLGCQDVLVFGLDLAYAESGATHASHSMYDDRSITGERFLRVPGNYGRTVLTTTHFALYTELLGAYVTGLRPEQAARIRSINPGGVAIDGLTCIPPASLEDPPLRGETQADPFAVLARAHDVIPRRGREAGLTGAIGRTTRELARLGRRAKRAEELCRSVAEMSEGHRASDVGAEELRKLASVERRMRQPSDNANRLVDAAVQAASMAAVTFCPEAGDESTRFREVHLRCALFYQEVHRAAGRLSDRLQVLQSNACA